MSMFLYSPPRIKKASVGITFSASNTTASHVLFTVTGVVQVYRIWGVVTTVIGANHTAGHLRTNDQGATIDLSESVTGATLSAFKAGSLLFKESLLAVALNAKSSAVAFVEECATAGIDSMTPFIVGKKNGAVTTIDYRYTTSDTPTSGAMTWFVEWEPLSADGNLS